MGGTRIPAASQVIAAFALVVSFSTPARAVTPLTLSGALAGTVRDVLGKPQMGASVSLYDRRDKLCERAITNEQGAFAFGGLLPDFYTVRVTLSSFLPAVRDHILVQAGIKRLLDVNLSAVFSSIQLVAPEAGQTSLMSDDWKWMLRNSSSMRPVLRILPSSSSSSSRNVAAMFSDTHVLVRLSGGDSSTSEAFSSDGDLGTTFAFGTSLYGSNQLQLSGNLGYTSASGLPSAAFRAAYSRPLFGGNPEVSITMHQLLFPNHVAGFNNIPGAEGNVPHMRTTAIAMGDKVQVSDAMDLEYGFEADNISYLGHKSYYSPYARLTYHDGETEVDFTYTSGNARPELGSQPAGFGDDLERDVAALARIPRVSIRDGATEVQRGEDYELGITRSIGSHDVRVAVYRESVTNAAVTVASTGPVEEFSNNIVPDLYSNTAVFNAGDYHTIGYTVSGSQHLGQHYTITVIYGSSGVLIPDASSPVSTADDLRSRIRSERRGAATIQGSGVIPVTGTRFFASYQWTDFRAATSGQPYSTDPNRPQPGLNAVIRQPIPSFLGLPRMEATADLRNLLAQGYIPVNLSDGGRLLLVRTPRSFRGGLTFTF